MAVVILNWNGKEDTLNCLLSLEKNTYKNFETIVVDNNSTDGSVEVIREKFPVITLLKTSQNLGYAGGNNVGITYALKRDVSFVLLLNNDTIVDKDLLKNFILEAEKKPEVGIFGGWPSLFSDPEILDHLGGNWNAKGAYFDLVGNRKKSLSVDETSLDYVCGCCMFIRREVFDKIGLLEDSYFLFWEDADFCMQAKRAGFGIWACKQAKLLHKVSASFIGGSIHKTYFWWRNRFLWIKRNCSFKERFSIAFRILIPEILHTYKMFFIKKCQLSLLKFLGSKKDLQKKELKIKQYKATLKGFQDYLLDRFGNGPDWIFRK